MAKKLHFTWVLWTLIICLLSLLPGDKLPTIEFDLFSIDSLVHAGMYGGLVFLLLLAFHLEKYQNNKLNRFDFQLYFIITALGIAFGWLIEFIQENFIHLRFYDLDDVIANGIGTILGAAAYWLMCRKITKMKRSA